MADTRDISCGKTSPERSAQTKARISRPSSKAYAGSKTNAFLFLDLQSGQSQERYWQTASPSLGELSTLSIGECPKEENVSTLSQILMAGVQEKYFLSPKACRGILNRAAVRGKQLPELLRLALEKQASA